MARPLMGDEPMEDRLIFTASKTLVDEIKDYWHDRKLDSKSEAIRELVEIGLKGWRKSKKS